MHTARARTALVSLLLVLTAAAVAQEREPAAPDAPPASRPDTAGEPELPAPEVMAEQRERRRRVLDALDEDSVLLVLSRARGVTRAKARNPNYEYLSPVQTEGAAVLLAPGTPAEPVDEESPATGSVDEESVDAANGAVGVVHNLYLPPRVPRLERWVGATVGPGRRTAERAGFDAALPSQQLLDDLKALLADRSKLYVSVDSSANGARRLDGLVRSLREELTGTWVRRSDAAGARREDALDGLESALPAGWRPGTSLEKLLARVRVVDVSPGGRFVARLRRVKSPREIEYVTAACEATARGIADALRVARPGGFEYDLAAVVELRCRQAGCVRQAFDSIAGSGPNSCILHYGRNTRRLEAGDVVVLDVGGEFRGYAADVTRTFPVSGRFTDEQAEVYDAVLAAQTAAIAAVAPGKTQREIHDVAVSVIKERGFGSHVMHGTCHAVGLEVHDVWSRTAKLEPGAVLTVEPGVYIAAKSLGVRIEDTVLVTEDGYRVLSAGVPKTREAIEALMAEEAPAGLLPR